MIPQSFIQDLLNRLDIVEVIGRTVPLKKAGANYSACCPFHSEKTPSFTVSPTKQFYHCFGCGAHGTLIDFVMETQGLAFVEAVHEMARMAGMQVPQAAGRGPAPVKDAHAELHAVLKQAARYYQQQLKQSPAAIAYLKQRGLSGEIAARFGLGYAPAGWQNLAEAVDDYQAKALVEAGLVIAGEAGKRYDRFRERIMFPIIGQKGAIIGFGGRVLGKGEPKYLNSPETPLFEKGQQLYGLAQARKAIRSAGQVLVVEGYMDVVALVQHGIEYAVATLGTATTGAHVQQLLRHTDTIVFCFDGDAAGRKAAWRALENSLPQLKDGKSLNFLFLPEPEDPDSFIRQHGSERFAEMMQQALPLSQFFVQELVKRTDTATQEGRVKLLQLAKPLVAQIQAPAFSLLLRKSLAQLAGVSQAELESLLELKQVARAGVASPEIPAEDGPTGAPPAYPRQAAAGYRGRPPYAGDKPWQRRRFAGDAPPPVPWTPRVKPSLERQMIELLVYQPAFVGQLEDAWLTGASQEAQVLTHLVQFLRQAPAPVPRSAIEAYFEAQDLQAMLRDILQQINEWRADFAAEAQFNDAAAKLRQQAEQTRLAMLLQQSKDLPSSQWSPELRQLLSAGPREKA